VWGYGHYGLLAALAAIGAGLEIAVEQVGHSADTSPVAVGYAIAVPVAAFMALTWALHAPLMPRQVLRPGLIVVGCAAVLTVPALQVSVTVTLALIAAVCSAVVALTLAFERTPALAWEAAT
jgi:hypothetical protein